MNKLEKKIKALEDEIVALKARIAFLEARPLVVTIPEAPVTVPSCPNPYTWPYDPTKPTITCSGKIEGLQSHFQNLS